MQTTNNGDLSSVEQMKKNDSFRKPKSAAEEDDYRALNEPVVCYILKFMSFIS